MAPSEELTVSIEFDLGSEPIEGRLRGAADARSFRGWIGLVGALDRMLREASAGSRPPSDSTSGGDR
jgi:hypothetical protein